MARNQGSARNWKADFNVADNSTVTLFIVEETLLSHSHFQALIETAGSMWMVGRVEADLQCQAMRQLMLPG